MNGRSVPAAVVAFLICTAGAQAQNTAHLHGTSRMNVVVDASHIEIELLAPGADIVGFEHRAKTGAQRKRVADALRSLGKGSALFAFPADAGCTLASVKVSSEMAGDPDDHDDDAGRHKDNDHGEGARAADKDHDHDHDKGADRDEGGHGEFRAHYRFRCRAPERLDHVDLMFFKRFPGMGKVRAAVLLRAGQRSVTLTKSRARLKF